MELPVVLELPGHRSAGVAGELEVAARGMQCSTLELLGTPDLPGVLELLGVLEVAARRMQCSTLELPGGLELLELGYRQTRKSSWGPRWELFPHFDRD